MSKTTNKLSEANFFLQQFEANYNEQAAGNYYLAAFISSARSVLWVMRSEYTDVDEWSTWYETKRPISVEAELLKKINNIRIRSEKRAPLQTKGRVVFYIEAENISEGLKEILAKNADATLRLTVAPLENEAVDRIEIEGDVVQFVAQIDDFYRTLEEFSDEDILESCKRYYSLLESIVFECDERFGK